MSKKRAIDADAGERPSPVDARRTSSRTRKRFALNLPRMIEEAGKAAAAWVEPREKGKAPRSRRRADGRHGQDLLQGRRILAVATPRAPLEAQTRLFSGYMTCGRRSLRRMMGEPVEPGRRARPGRQALPGSGMGQERLLRLPEAGLSGHRRAGRATWSSTPTGSTSTPATRPTSTSSRSPTRSRRRTSS